MENKFMDKAMDDMELDCVIGGAGFAYFMKRKDGRYDIVSESDKLDPAQARGLVAGKAPAELNIPKSITFRFNIGIQANQIGRIKERLNKFYKGCTFVNI